MNIAMQFTKRELIKIGGALAASGMITVGRDTAAACEIPPIHYDADGLIVHEGMDGGDTAQREGWYWLGVGIREKILNDPWPIERSVANKTGQDAFIAVLDLLEPKKDGVFYRHPKLPPWNNPYDQKFGFSRDQMVPLVAAMGMYGFTDRIRRLWNALPQDVIGGTKHTFNCQWQTVLGQRTICIGDIVGPSTINLFKRAWNEAPDDEVGEKELEANSGLHVPPFESNRDNVGDDLNHIVMLLMSILRHQSNTSKKAVHIYSKNRLVSYGSFVNEYRNHYNVDVDCVPFTAEIRNNLDQGIASGWQPDSSRVLGAVRWYHRKGAGANPALAQLYEPIVKKYLE